MRIGVAGDGGRMPLNVMDGTYRSRADVCPWWNAVTTRRAG